MTFQNLRPEEAQQALQQDPNIRVLDVRTQPEHDSHRIDGALLIPVQEIHMRSGELDPDTHYLVACEHGVRSVAACEFLAKQGFEHLTNIVGGMAQWVGDGLPFVGRNAQR